MKSLLDISFQVSEAEYRKDGAYSYSLISSYQREGFEALVTGKLFERKSTPSLTFGSLVDCMFTEPERFDELFIVSDESVSDSVANCIHELLELQPKARSLDDIDDAIISNVCVNNGFWANDKWEKRRVSEIKKAGSAYFIARKYMGDRQPISQEMYDTARECVDKLRSHEVIQELLLDEEEGKEVLFQPKFKSDYLGIPVRCMFDAVVVYHNLKLIIPVDLKTSSKPEWDFPKSYVDWNYRYQSNLYAYILSRNILEDEYFNDFQIDSYRFIVVNKETKSPMVWIDDSIYEDGSYSFGRLKRPSWREVLEDLHDAMTTNRKLPKWAGPTNSISNSLEAYYD